MNIKQLKQFFFFLQNLLNSEKQKNAPFVIM